MDTNVATDEPDRASRKRFSFGISNLLMLMAFFAVCVAWWGDRNRKTIQQYDIAGPISVSYTVRTSPTSTAGSQMTGVTGIDFEGNNVILHTAGGGFVLSGSSLINFSWNPE